MPDPHFKVIRLRLALITSILSVAVLVSFCLAAWSFVVVHDTAMRQRSILCNAQNQSNHALRSVLLLAEGLAASNKRVTPEERVVAADFYKRALHLVDPVPCQRS